MILLLSKGYLDKVREYYVMEINRSHNLNSKIQQYSKLGGKCLENIIEEFKKLYTGAVSDVMDKIGVRVYMDAEIRPLIPDKVICGTAVTVRAVPACKVSPPTYMFETVNKAKKGDVIVIDTNGHKNLAIWGELMSTASMVREVEATVIDGGTRDVLRIRKLGYQVYSRTIVCGGPRGRLEIVENDIPISCGGIAVRPGDIIFGDFDGVVVIPKEMAGEILEKSKSYAQIEEKVAKDLQAGMDVFHSFRWKK